MNLRKRISDSNKQPVKNYFDEYCRIESMFTDVKSIGNYDQFGHRKMPYFTLADYLNELQFNNWNLRGRYISLEDMRLGLKITKEDMETNFSNGKFLDFLQFILNCTFRIQATLKKCSSVYLAEEHLPNMIIDNTKFVLNDMNYEINLDKSIQEIFIIEKNIYSTAVSEVHEDIKDSIIEYRRHDLEGDIKRKTEILCTLWKKYEPIRSKLKANNLTGLDDNIGFIFNEVVVRHNNIEGPKANKAAQSLSPKELEIWADRSYDMFLLAMLHFEYFSYKKEIEDLVVLKNSKGGTS